MVTGTPKARQKLKQKSSAATLLAPYTVADRRGWDSSIGRYQALRDGPGRYTASLLAYTNRWTGGFAERAAMSSVNVLRTFRSKNSWSLLPREVRAPPRW